MSRIPVDTGVFSASLSIRRRQGFEGQVRAMTGKSVFLAAQTVAELRYGALVAGWGDARRLVGHPLASEVHAADVWIAASGRHVQAPLLSADAVFENAPGVLRA